MRLRILKFGGTSLYGQQCWERAVRHVLSYDRREYALLVVVSAMGREGAPYATDTLIELAESFCDSLPRRDMDLMMSCGELIAAVAMAGALRAAGLETLALTGRQAGIVTDDSFGDARVCRVETSKPLRIIERGQVAVVAGFQGATEDGEITTLGRGGSDVSAAALAVSLRAELLEIFTDVTGIKTADPRVVPEAVTIEEMSYEEVHQMAQNGAHVVHPRAVQIAMAGDVPMRVRSTFNDHPGTLVTNRSANSRVVIGVTQMTDVAQLSVNGNQRDGGRIFRSLAEAGISVDLINVSPDEVVFTVADGSRERASLILEDLGYEANIREGCAKVTVVGAGMKGIPGVMARIVDSLNGAGIDILQTCDSHLSISCLVPREKVTDAVQVLHRYFDLNGGGGESQ